MLFEKELGELVRNVDALGAILIDWEGESVAFAGSIDDYRLKVMGAYQVIILHSLRKAAGGEAVKFFQLTFDNLLALLMPVNNDYHVLLLFDNRERASRALHSLTRVVETFAAEIA